MNAIERDRPRSRLFGHGSKKFLCNPPPRQRDAIGRVFEGGRCQFIQPALRDGAGERVVGRKQNQFVVPQVIGCGLRHA